MPTRTLLSEFYAEEDCESLAYTTPHSWERKEMRAGHVWKHSPAFKGEFVNDLEDLCEGAFADAGMCMCVCVYVWVYI